MQLIELVQLVLVGFIVTSLVIFFISYLGFLKKSKKNENFIKAEKKNKISVNEKVQPITTNQKEKIKNSEKEIPVTKKEIIKSIENKSKQSRFEVFKPTKEKEHYPKTLSVKISKDNNSNK